MGRYRNWAKVEFEEHASVSKAKEGVKVWEMFLGRRLEVKVGGKEEGERRREEGRRGVKRAVSEPVGGGEETVERTKNTRKRKEWSLITVPYPAERSSAILDSDATTTATQF